MSTELIDPRPAWREQLTSFETRLGVREQTLARETRRRVNLQAVMDTHAEDIADYEKSIALCMACIDRQVNAKEHIEQIATALLNTVMQGVHRDTEAFGDPPVYAYVLQPIEDAMGMVTGLKPMVSKNEILDDPKNYGGGVRNLVAFANRLIYLLLNPSISQVMVLDEPMTNLSPHAWKHVVRFLEDLLKDMPLQVIAITHSGADFPDTYRVYRQGDTSKIERVIA